MDGVCDRWRRCFKRHFVHCLCAGTDSRTDTDLSLVGAVLADSNASAYTYSYADTYAPILSLVDALLSNTNALPDTHTVSDAHAYLLLVGIAMSI